MLEINITQYLFVYDRIYRDDGMKYPLLRDFAVSDSMQFWMCKMFNKVF